MAKSTAIDVLRAPTMEWLAVEGDVEWIGDLVDSHVGPSTLIARPEYVRDVCDPLTSDERDKFLATLDGVSNAEPTDAPQSALATMPCRSRSPVSSADVRHRARGGPRHASLR
ncbi:hypothetical protein [Demequina iriomotensis]|uniref:hypothetical protein n=1 Tax=Demequina iriomotensis TaxID=1536641 RepID=UPI000780FD53|nr:hypothetical protein [Demequina iriomotensis]